MHLDLTERRKETQRHNAAEPQPNRDEPQARVFPSGDRRRGRGGQFGATFRVSDHPRLRRLRKKEIRGQTYKSPNYVQRFLIRNWVIYTSVPEFLFVPFVFPSNLD